MFQLNRKKTHVAQFDNRNTRLFGLRGQHVQGKRVSVDDLRQHVQLNGQIDARQPIANDEVETMCTAVYRAHTQQTLQLRQE